MQIDLATLTSQVGVVYRRTNGHCLSCPAKSVGQIMSLDSRVLVICLSKTQTLIKFQFLGTYHLLESIAVQSVLPFIKLIT